MKNKALISVFTKSFCLFFVFLFSSAYAQQKIEIGVRAINGKAKALEKWSATADHLTLKIPNYQFEIVPIVLFKDMQKAVENKQLDFVLTNPSAYINLQEKYGVYPIATLLNGRMGNGLCKFGGVVFTRADRKDLNLLSDIRGHSIMGVDTVSFGGWQMLYRELLEMNIDPYQDCSQVLFSRISMQNDVVFDVLNGKADFGTVRTGILENLEQQHLLVSDSFKVINPVSDSFPYLHTTRLYSEWAFSALKNTDKSLIKKTIVALLQVSKLDTASVQGGYSGWEISQNYTDVLDLLKIIKAPPFDQEVFSFYDFFLRYWIWFFIVLLIITGLALFLLYNRILNKNLSVLNQNLEQKVEKRSRELLKAQQDWESIFNSIASPAQLIDKQHKIKYVNQATLQVFKLKEEDLIGKSCFTLFHNSSSAPQSCPLVKALQEGKNAVEEMVFEGLDRVFIVSCSPIYDSKGSVESFMHIMTDITERKTMEKQLTESRSHFEVLFNFGVEAVFVHPFREKGFQNFIEVNQVACRLFGYSKEEFLNLSASDISSQADADEKGSTLYRQQLNKEKNRLFEAVMIKKSGEKFPVEISSTTFDYQGQRVIMSVVRDLTERKKAESEVEASRKYVQGVLDSTSDIIFVHDAETGAVLDVNQQFTKLYGFEKEEVLNGSVQSMSLGESPYSDKEAQEWLRKSQTEGKQTFEWRARHKDGHLFWAEVSIVFVQIEGKNRYLASVRDIDDRKKMEEALQKSEEKFRAAFESSMDAISISHINDGTYININKGFLDMTGFTESEVVGKTSIELNIWADPKDRKKLVEAIKTKGYINNLEARFLAKDGSEIIGLMSANVVNINHENHILSLTRDISDRKKAEDELKIEREFSNKIINTSSALIVGLDINHKIRIFNKGAEKITGFSKEEVIGKDWFKLFFQKDIIDEMNLVWKNSWGIKEHSYENPIRIKSGEERIISWQTTGIYEDEDTSRHLLISIGEDITESRKIEMFIRKSEANLKALIENRADSIWSVDRNFNYIIFNKSFAQSYYRAYNQELKTASNALEILSPKLLDFWKPKYESVLKGETIVFEFIENYGGAEHSFRVSLNPIIIDDAVTGVSAISMEITAIKEAEKELKIYRQHLEKLVKERTQDLEEKNQELKRINTLFVGRENRMAELKEEIERLRKA